MPLDGGTPALDERQLLLATVLVAFTREIVDAIIVNTALPGIQASIGASEAEVHVQTASAAALLRTTLMSVSEAIRRMGISEQTLYLWKKMHGGLGVGEQRCLKLLEEEIPRRGHQR